MAGFGSGFHACCVVLFVIDVSLGGGTGVKVTGVSGVLDAVRIAVVTPGDLSDWVDDAC